VVSDLDVTAGAGRIGNGGQISISAAMIAVTGGAALNVGFDLIRRMVGKCGGHVAVAAEPIGGVWIIGPGIGAGGHEGLMADVTAIVPHRVGCR